MLKHNKDILIFQILNWSGTYFLYISFLKVFPASVFSKIASGEVFFGAVGSFLMIYSLRVLEEEMSLKKELQNLIFRICLTLCSFLIITFLNINIVFWIALLQVLVIPVHLPVKLGYNYIAYSVISLKLILATVIFYFKPFLNENWEIALLYFSPGIIYGMIIYYYYIYNFKYLTKTLEKKISKKNKNFTLTHIILVIISSMTSAVVVARVVELGFNYGAIERLLRSGYSFIYPYLIRFNLHNYKGNYIILNPILLILLLFYSINNLFLIFIPVVIDALMTIGINKKIKADIISGVLLILILWSVYV